MSKQEINTKTRGKQAGGIYKRANGLWVATIELGYEGGKRKRKFITSTTKAALLEKLEAARKQERDGVQDPDRLTVGAVVEEWLNGLEASKSVKISTLANYRLVAERYVIPFVGSKRLADLKVGDVEKMLLDLQGVPVTPQVGRGIDPATMARVEAIVTILDSLRRPKLPLAVTLVEAIERLQKEGHDVTNLAGGNDRVGLAFKRPDIRKAISLRRLRTKTGVSPNTRRLARTVLGMAIRDAQRKEYVNRNVAALTRGPKIAGSYEGRSLSPEQARTLIAAVVDHRIETYVVVGVSLGLRPGETLALRWEDIDFENETLAVNGTLSRTPDGIVRQSPKTSKRNALS